MAWLQIHAHQPTDRSGGGVPDGDLLFFQDLVPAGSVELGLVHDQGDAMAEGGADSVRGAGDPAWVGGAPEDIVRVQVEGIVGAHIVEEHGLVDMKCPLGCTRGAAGEVQQGVLFWVGRRNRELGGGCRHQLGQREHRAVQVGRDVGQQHILQRRQPRPHFGDFALLEQPFGRDQHPAVAKGQTLLDRPGAEG